MGSILRNLTKYKWEIFLFVSIFVIFICWFLKDKNEDEENEYKVNFDYNLLNVKKVENKKYRNKTENICRNIVENIYMKPFPCVRPHFLKNPKTGRNLELDMYNEELALALEYDGQQHSHYSPYFHKNYNDFLEQLERDQFKKDRCIEVGITLIKIPYTVRKEELEFYIKKELRKLGKI